MKLMLGFYGAMWPSLGRRGPVSSVSAIWGNDDIVDDSRYRAVVALFLPFADETP